MNYYEHHIGDYIKATAHLSMLEDAAYRRLIDAYYSREAPLPVDKKACYRLVRANSKVEKAAVDAVLSEFFSLDDDGWHQTRCDEEIEKYTAKKPEADKRRESERDRQKRARERRKALFEELSGHGINMPWNATTEQLQAELSRVTVGDESRTVTPPVTRDNTATQTPVPSPQSPVLKNHNPEVALVDKTPRADETPPAPNDTSQAGSTRKGELCRKLRALGFDAAPHLEAWSEILPKYSDDEILAVAETAREKKPGERLHLNYLLPMLRDTAAPKASKPKEPPWWSSESAMLAKGQELGLAPWGGESWQQFRGRIDAKIAERAAA